MKHLLLDTDIGPDCDDAAALALAHIYADRGCAELLCVTHCTSMPWGAGAIRAINAWYGRPNLPVGTLKDEGFLCAPEYQRYNRALSEMAEQREAPDALEIFRHALREAPDASVTIVAIGPLRNIANILRSDRPLIAAKAAELVLMAGNFADSAQTEWNIEMDIPSARYVAENWPTPMVYCGFEVGENVISGGHMREALPENHPVRRAYALHGSEGGRSSWDLLTVQWALDEEGFRLSPPGIIAIDESGGTRFAEAKGGKHHYVILEKSPEEAAESLNALLAR